MLTTTLGERIRSARLAIPGLTQAKLAEAVGIHRVHLARIECGMRNPSDSLLSRLTQALGLDGDA